MLDRRKRGLVEQIKDAKDLLATLQPENKDADIKGVPATVAIELKRMDHDLQIQLQKMVHERQQRDQEFQLKLRKFDENHRAGRRLLRNE